MENVKDEISMREHQQLVDMAKGNQRRIEKLENNYEALNNLTASLGEMKARQEHTDEEIGEVKDKIGNIESDVKTIAEKPAKRWEAVVEKALLAAVAAIVAYLFSQIGIG